MIFAFLTGMVIMSISSMIAVWLVDDGKDWGKLFCGPAFWIVVLFGFVKSGVSHWVKFHDKRSLLFDEENGVLYAVPIWATEAYRLVKGWNFPSKYSSNENNRRIAAAIQKRKKEWDEQDINMGQVNMRYAPKSVWHNRLQVTRRGAKQILRESKRQENDFPAW